MAQNAGSAPPHPAALSRFIVRRKNRLLLRLSLMFSVLLVLCGIFLGSTGPSTAHAASGLPYKTVSGESESPPLQFYAAAGKLFVQHHPKVYLVFWGPDWKQDTDGVIPRVNATFKALAGSQYNNILRQYTDSSDYVHNDVTLVASVIDTSTPPSNLDIGIETDIGVLLNGQIRNEADKAISANHWAVNQDSLVIVFPQKGSTYFHGSGWCGVHTSNTTAASPYLYAEIQYGDQTNCDNVGNPAEDIAWNAVHEYAEAATDPVIFGTLSASSALVGALGSGWHTRDSSKSTPQEVADLCAGYDGYPGDPAYHDYQDPYTGTYYSLPLLWSNAANGCVTAAGKSYSSPASPYRHTVQGGILSEYQNVLLANGYPIGSPLSEEVSITGGAVSYFTGGCNENGPGAYGSCGAIYWSSATGAHGIWGDDYSTYLSRGGPGGNFGFPTSDPTYENGGAVSYFQGSPYCSGNQSDCAAIYSNSSAGTWSIWGGDLQKYQSEGETGGYFGWPTSDPNYVNGGAVSLFQGTHYCSGGQTNCAAIYASSTGNYAIWGSDLATYRALDPSGYGTGSNLGWPTSDPNYVTGGAISNFQHGAIYTGPDGTYADWGNDYKTYVAEGATGGNLGWPTSNPVYVTGGAISTFQNGAIYDDSDGTFADWGDDYAKYLAEGGQNGYFGWPQSSPDYLTGGAVSYFQGTHYCASNMVWGCAAIYDSSAYGAYAVWGSVLLGYENAGGPAELGWPLHDPVYLAGGGATYLSGGGTSGAGPYGSSSAVYSTSAVSLAHEVNGAIYQAYINYGGPGSALGFPTTDEYTNSSGYRESDFQNGYIIWENGPIAIGLYGSGGCAITASSPATVQPNIVSC